MSNIPGLSYHGYDILRVSIPWQLAKNRITYKETKNIKLDKMEGV